MKVGDYCRTKDGFIARLIDKDTWYKFDGIIAENEYTYDYLLKEVAKKLIIKSSPNIIDLIEVGDYVNGHQVLDIAETPKRVLYLNDISQKGALIPRKNIKSIVTKEQFSSMEYRINE